MEFTPVFKHVLIQPIVEEKLNGQKEEKKILIPEEYEERSSLPPYTKCKCLKFAIDCILNKVFISAMNENRILFVRTNMIEKLEINNEILYIVPENAIVLVATNT